MSDPKTEFQAGQLVEYIGKASSLAGVWEIVGYNRPDDGRHLWDVRRPEDHEKVSAIYNTNMRLIKAKEEVTAGCTCPINVLMQRGCVCGQMERERRTKPSVSEN